MNPQHETINPSSGLGPDSSRRQSGRHFKTKFEVYGEESIVKQVKQSGGSGRIYLPPAWVGKVVKVIRID